MQFAPVWGQQTRGLSKCLLRRIPLLRMEISLSTERSRRRPLVAVTASRASEACTRCDLHKISFLGLRNYDRYDKIFACSPLFLHSREAF